MNIIDVFIMKSCHVTLILLQEGKTAVDMATERGYVPAMISLRACVRKHNEVSQYVFDELLLLLVRS